MHDKIFRYLDSKTSVRRIKLVNTDWGVLHEYENIQYHDKKFIYISVGRSTPNTLHRTGLLVDTTTNDYRTFLLTQQDRYCRRLGEDDTGRFPKLIFRRIDAGTYYTLDLMVISILYL